MTTASTGERPARLGVSHDPGGHRDRQTAGVGPVEHERPLILERLGAPTFAPRARIARNTDPAGRTPRAAQIGGVAAVIGSHDANLTTDAVEALTFDHAGTDRL